MEDNTLDLAKALQANILRREANRAQSRSHKDQRKAKNRVARKSRQNNRSK